MSRLPYLCNFRIILHTYEREHEVFDISTWVEGFEFRSLQQFENDKNFLFKWLNHPGNIKMEEGLKRYINDKLISGSEYGKDIIESGNIIHHIIESYINPDDKDHYYEVIGKLYFASYQNHEGEWDSDDEVDDIIFQELSKEDVDAWAKDNGLELNP